MGYISMWLIRPQRVLEVNEEVVANKGYGFPLVWYSDVPMLSGHTIIFLENLVVNMVIFSLFFYAVQLRVKLHKKATIICLILTVVLFLFDLLYFQRCSFRSYEFDYLFGF